MKFGTDGIRGIFQTELKTNHAYSIGYAIGKMAKEFLGEGSGKIVVGRDTRKSGQELQKALVAGISEGGSTSYLLGVVPTPAVQFYSKKFAYGVMITASHNGAEYNGIKVFASNGKKLTEIEEQKIEECLGKLKKHICIQKESFRQKRPTEYIYSRKQNLVPITKRIAIDCANGAASRIAKKIFEGQNIVWLHCNPNGKNINKNCGSTKLGSLKEAVVKNKCDIGFAFDGDADRCLAVDEKGNEITGDNILYILANSMKRKGRLLGGVVATEFSTLSLKEALLRCGIEYEQTIVGDKYVKQKMEEKNWNLGGERSGHIIISDKAETGDGILTAIELICVLEQSGGKASALSKGFSSLFRYEINIKQNNGLVKKAINIASELNKTLSLERIVIRKSGTENLIRIMCESGSARRAKMFATYFQSLLQI